VKSWCSLSVAERWLFFPSGNSFINNPKSMLSRCRDYLAWTYIFWYNIKSYERIVIGILLRELVRFKLLCFIRHPCSTYRVEWWLSVSVSLGVNTFTLSIIIPLSIAAWKPRAQYSQAEISVWETSIQKNLFILALWVKTNKQTQQCPTGEVIIWWSD